MKLLLSVVIAATVLTGTANAQDVKFGIKGGLNESDIRQSNGPNYEPVTGFYAGFLSHIHLTKRFALQPEVFYC
jgi:hypothetical protein